MQNTNRRNTLKAISLITASTIIPAQKTNAQLKIEVTGIGQKQIPISINTFQTSGAVPQNITEIIKADLTRSGLFKLLPSIAEHGANESTPPNPAAWLPTGVEAITSGSIKQIAGGKWDIRFRLWDIVKNQDLGGQGYIVPAADLRLAAHKIADYIYEKLTSYKGIFSTRLAYITKTSGKYTLWVADSDGENSQAALTSQEPIISPAWSPKGAQLAYVSFESRKPVIYVHTIATGQRKLLANFKGSNSAPTWSPDGQTLAVTLSRDGGSQLYLISAKGGQAQRITQTTGIDTEPTFSPDGQTIYFTSDRGGAPQIYKMHKNAGQASRVTFEGNYNVSPAISPDGKHMAYISRGAGGYKLTIMDLNSGQTAQLTNTSDDESPSFAPNSRLIVYASKQNGQEALMTTTIDGQIKTKLASQRGEIREPAWGPY